MVLAENVLLGRAAYRSPIAVTGTPNERGPMRMFPSSLEHPGLASRAELLRAGWTKSAIENLARQSGRRVHSGVYCAHRGPLTPDDELKAQALWAGPEAVLTCSRALRLHGLSIEWEPTVAVFLVPKSHEGKQTVGARTARTARIARSRTLEGIAVAPIERALTDSGLFKEAGPKQLRALTISVLQRRLTTPARLAQALASARRNGTAGIRQGLRDFSGGAWSVAEANLLSLLATRRPGLLVLPNPRLLAADGTLIGVPDAYLPQYAVAIQVHSLAFHSGTLDGGRDAWEMTVEGDSVYLEHGIALLAVAPTAIRDDPDRFLARLGRVLASRMGVSAAVRIAA